MTCPYGICEIRHVGCHAECDAYKAWDAEKWKQREEESRQKDRDVLLNSVRADAIRKQRRRHR